MTAGEELLRSAFDGSYVALYRFVLQRLPGREEEAEDITMEAFQALAEALNAPEGRGAFGGRSSAYTWLCAVAKRKIVDRYRRELRLPRISYDPLELRELPSEGPAGGPLTSTAFGPEELCLDSERRERVRACLEALPPERRYALILKYVDGLSVAELARILGKSDKAAEALLSRARESFADLYEKEETRG
jgi:RNA polymerase sigma-70 factor, ECF subfamily